MSLSLVQKILRLHRALDDAAVPHAFGGALALAFCTNDPRGTSDIDVNIFVSTDKAIEVLAHLPRGIGFDDADLRRIATEAQARLWWGETPVDVFFSNHPFHERARSRHRVVPFEGLDLPVLDCTDLSVFKAFFARTKDLADIEAMAEAGSVDRDDALATVEELLGRSHPNWRSLAEALDAGTERRDEGS